MNPVSSQNNAVPFGEPKNVQPKSIDDLIKEYRFLINESMSRTDECHNEFLKLQSNYEELMEAAQITSDLLIKSGEVIQKLTREQVGTSKRATASEVATKVIGAVAAVFFFFLYLLWDVVQFIVETTSRTCVWLNGGVAQHSHVFHS